DVNGANIAQCLGGLHDYILGRFLPTFRRFRKYLDHFYDFWHELDFLSLPFRAASRIWPQVGRRGDVKQMWLRRLNQYRSSKGLLDTPAHEKPSNAQARRPRRQHSAGNAESRRTQCAD